MANTTKATELSQLSSALQVDESTGEIIFTGSLSVDSNTLFIDSDSNRVGIGTLTPGSALDVSGDVSVSGTVDGRNVSSDGSKLDTIETSADVTDTANVTSAGALMDSELTNESAIKNIDQELTTSSDVEFGGLDVDSGTLFVDSVNDRVGINTSSPSSALEIAGALVASGAIRSEEEYTQIAQGFIQREQTRGDLDVDLAVAIELNLLGAPVAGGYYAGLIDTTGDGSIQSNDDYQSGQRYALIVSDKSLEGGLGSSPASGLPTGDLRWDALDRAGEAGAFTRWNGLDATNVIIAKNDTSYEVHDFIEAVRSQYPAPTTPGGSEWYLPAMDELELLYRNFKPNNADNDTRDFPRNFPGSNPSGKNLSSVPEGFNYENSPRIPDVTYLDLFKEGNAQAIDLDRYWSTTDADDDGRAWIQDFTFSGIEGFQVATIKDSTFPRVRPVRRVVLDDSNDTKNRSGNYNINGSITAHGLNTDGGDVSFTEDTGTTPKFVWDASAEQLDVDGTLNVDSGTLFVDSVNNSVGVGTSNPAASNAGSSLDATGVVIARNRLASNQTSAAVMELSGDEVQFRAYGATAGSGLMTFNVGGGGNNADFEAARIDSSGNLLVGTTTSPSGVENSFVPGGKGIIGSSIIQSEFKSPDEAGTFTISLSSSALLTGYIDVTIIGSYNTSNREGYASYKVLFNRESNSVTTITVQPPTSANGNFSSGFSFTASKIDRFTLNLDIDKPSGAAYSVLLNGQIVRNFLTSVSTSFV